MVFDKLWNSLADGDYADAANWKPISLRNASWSWTASGSGTNEYYLRTAANGDPGFAASPAQLLLDGAAATPGTVGALAAGEWGFSDNDTLGYSTIYVRLADGADPDAKPLDYVEFRQIPQTGDHVRIPPDTASITAGLDQSAVAIGDFIVERGYTGIIGSGAEYLRIDPNRFEFTGRGTAYIDLTTANIDVQVFETDSPQAGARGLYLLGSNLKLVNVVSGHVGIAIRHGESSLLVTARVVGDSASLWLGEGCAATNWQQYQGIGILRCAVTNVLLYAGELTTEEAGAITAVTHKGGELIYNSSGTITTYDLVAGTLDTLRSGIARTITTLNWSGGMLRYSAESLTIGTLNRMQSGVLGFDPLSI